MISWSAVIGLFVSLRYAVVLSWATLSPARPAVDDYSMLFELSKAEGWTTCANLIDDYDYDYGYGYGYVYAYAYTYICICVRVCIYLCNVMYAFYIM